METILKFFTLGNNDLKPYATTSVSRIADYIRVNGASCGLSGLTNYDIEDKLESLIPTYATKIDGFTYQLTDKGYEVLMRTKKLEETK